jgi:hypothetical protein
METGREEILTRTTSFLILRWRERAVLSKEEEKGSEAEEMLVERALAVAAAVEHQWLWQMHRQWKRGIIETTGGFSL